MRLLGRFIDLAEHAVAAGLHTDRIARMDCMRPLQRMGEEIGDADLPRFAELQAAMEREFAELTPATQGGDAAHG